MKIGLVYPLNREGVDAVKHDVLSVLNSYNVDVVDQADQDSVSEIDYLITIGGDGTVLKAVSYLVERKVPILGVNLGHLGYLTEVEPVNVKTSIKDLIDGNFRLEGRMILTTSVFRCGNLESSGLTSLNDVVIEKVEPGKTIRFQLLINGLAFERYSADGIVICTPTGSTAYNLSIQGPIVAPNLDAVIITPIAPHLVFDRSLVLDPTAELELLMEGDREASLVVDGAVKAVLKEGDSVIIGTKKEQVQLVKLRNDEYFIDKLKSKF